jgi:hypothetical protein
MRPLGTSKVLFFATVGNCFVLAALAGTESAFARRQTVVPAPETVMHGELPLTKFYDTPVPIPAGKPGELVRSQPFYEYHLAEGVSTVRILYHSIAANGQDVAASGVVLVPFGTSPAGGWPVIAWAHPFIAIGRACAPSLLRDLRSGPFLSMYVNLGYAVVATDYVGLGTRFLNAFVDVRSNATDVIYSVPAARAAVPQLSPRWVAMGDGEGGAAALAVAELENQMDDPNYLGSVAISGAMNLKTLMERLAQGRWEDTFASLAYGTKTVYPKFQVDDILSPKALARYREIDKTCRTRTYDNAPPLRDMLKATWENNPFVRDFLERNTLGLSPARAPLLVISTDNAKSTYSMAAQVVARMCQQRDRIDFEAYPGLDPAAVIGESVGAQIAWIKARFSGRTTPNNCP